MLKRNRLMAVVAAAALLLGVACLIAVDVFLRAVLNHPIIGVAEIVANADKARAKLGWQPKHADLDLRGWSARRDLATNPQAVGSTLKYSRGLS